LKVAREWIDAYIFLGIERIKTDMSKNYEYQMLPKSAGLHEETKEEPKVWGVSPVFTNFKVRIQYSTPDYTTFKFADKHLLP